MAIIKSKHAGNFTVLPNEIFNSDLSAQAIGILAYMLSLPADWVLYKENIRDKFNIGRDGMRSIIKELEAKGYFLSVQKRTAKGVFEYDYIVYDKPFNGETPILQHTQPHTDYPLTAKPPTAEPPTDSPQVDNPPPTKETLILNTNNTNTLSNLEIFDLFRKKYQGTRRGNKTELSEFQKKHKDWQQVLPTLELVIDNQIKDAEIKKQRGEFVPEWKNLTTWLNQRCWEQELKYVGKVQSIEIKPEVNKEEQIQKALDIHANIFPQ